MYKWHCPCEPHFQWLWGGNRHMNPTGSAALCCTSTGEMPISQGEKRSLKFSNQWGTKCTRKRKTKCLYCWEKWWYNLLQGSFFQHPFCREVRHRHGTGMQMDNSCTLPTHLSTTVVFSPLNETKFVRDYIFFLKQLPTQEENHPPLWVHKPFSWSRGGL